MKQLDLSELKNLNTSYFRDFYLRTYGGDKFIDKTPGAVACHGWRVIKDAFPSAAIVACVRSPVEVYESALSKFIRHRGDSLETDLSDIAKGWVASMKGIESMASSEFSEDLHTVSQLDLRARPGRTAEELFKFLCVTNYATADIMIFCKGSRDDILTDSIERVSYKKLDELCISEDQKTAFRLICSETCAKWKIPI